VLEIYEAQVAGISLQTVFVPSGLLFIERNSIGPVIPFSIIHVW
jgi:hypothetical protein